MSALEILFHFAISALLCNYLVLFCATL